MDGRPGTPNALPAGRRNASDERVGPHDCLLHGRQDVETFGGLGVEGLPLVSSQNGRRPWLLLPVVESRMHVDAT